MPSCSIANFVCDHTLSLLDDLGLQTCRLSDEWSSSHFPKHIYFMWPNIRYPDALKRFISYSWRIIFIGLCNLRCSQSLWGKPGNVCKSGKVQQLCSIPCVPAAACLPFFATQCDSGRSQSVTYTKASSCPKLCLDAQREKSSVAKMNMREFMLTDSIIITLVPLRKSQQGTFVMLWSTVNTFTLSFPILQFSFHRHTALATRMIIKYWLWDGRRESFTPQCCCSDTDRLTPHLVWC